MIGYFIFFMFLAIFAYVSVRWGTFLISDLIAGLILLIFFTYYHFRNDLDRAAIIVIVVNLTLYIFQFISSVFIYFDEENEKRSYWIFTILAFVFLIMAEKMMTNFDDSFWSMYVPVALAFFPLYFLKYFFKYIREED
ncbi:hypothetical protein [Flavobacterium branchiicola]|uniref:Rod shape-determining protein MreD n=1 Tax=Flavobacterium branchiicola TaxID=1114875 RepID=A0ABV9PI02_9FLAO|nr:hypothetical protein [Flavobacterium branchiicola]MBS7256495.1 hypothetical protein [Flavobacterium branchiicola]